jgi:hypothetical protein
MAALERLKIHAKKVDVAHSVAEDAFFDARRENGVGVILDGEEMRTHEQIDAHFTPAFEDEEQFNRFVEKLRQRCLPDVERDMARLAAHDQLAVKEAAIAEVKQRIGLQEIEARKNAADDAVWDAENDVMKAKPATLAGAISLLRFVADLFEELSADTEDRHYVMAIHNAADFFERSAS